MRQPRPRRRRRRRRTRRRIDDGSAIPKPADTGERGWFGCVLAS